MQISYSAAERTLQAEIQDYFATVISPATVKALSEPDFDRDVYRETVAQVGHDGWLSRSWPDEHGGRGGSWIDQYIFFNEARKASIPLPYLTVTSVAPAIMNYGSDEQKQTLLPRIAAGDVVFGIGYTEPQAGTDLAALSTCAHLDGEDYVIDGQKLYTSLAHLADYIWLAVRTSGDSKHDGISIVIVPTDADGFSLTPIHTIGDYRTNTTYYDGVRVPASSLVGGPGNGWQVMRSQLDYERVALANPGYIEKQLREVHRWARQTRRTDGTRPLDDPRVRTALARVYAVHEALKLLNWKLAASIQARDVLPEQASAVKVFGTESALDAYEDLMDILADDGYAKAYSSGAVVGTDLEKAYRRDLTFTFGGGANEVQRQIIARRLLHSTKGGH